MNHHRKTGKSFPDGPTTSENDFSDLMDMRGPFRASKWEKCSDRDSRSRKVAELAKG
jgi:hypothetical protein